MGNCNQKVPVARKGFTLLEVLIAGGILFIVSAAIVGLNNSIIQGTAVNANVTVLNRWSSEGLELVSAVRDNNVLASNSDGNNPIWFNQAVSTNLYGWYRLAKNGNNWTLSPAPGTSNVISYPQFSGTTGESLTSQSITAYRLICIEAVGAAVHRDDASVSCNTDASGSPIASDGDRTKVAAPCDPNDVFCTNTEPSLNRDELGSIAATTPNIIPPGNAVKVRAVVVTQNKTNYVVSDVATLLTNWLGFEQNAGFSNATGSPPLDCIVPPGTPCATNPIGGV